MKTIHRGVFAMVLLSLLVSCIVIPTALAAPAADVWVNGVHLTASLPYWKNGSTTASATEPLDGWNAYFNAPTGTLTLKNAVINTPSAFLTAYSLVCAVGDLSLVLSGTNTISWNSNTQEDICGITIQGMLSISGDGSADIEIVNTHASGTAVAVLSYYNLTLVSGRIESTAQAASIAHGLYSMQNILIAGGQAVVNTKAPSTTGVFSSVYEFRMTGGSITVRAEGTDGTGTSDTWALFCSQPYLEGGTGSFTAYGSGRYLSGLCYSADTLSYSGGSFTFTGPTSALLNNGSTTGITYNLNDDALVYASKSTSGTAPILWKSDADGILTSLLLVPSMSEFLYVRFTQPVTPPQTGDVQTPLLWTGIALCVLLGAVGLKRRTRLECR